MTTDRDAAAGRYAEQKFRQTSFRGPVDQHVQAAFRAGWDAAMEQARQVKPLEWKLWTTNRKTGRVTYKAFGCGYTYVIRETAKGATADFGVLAQPDPFASVDDAKEAAQADYAERILGALQPPASTGGA